MSIRRSAYIGQVRRESPTLKPFKYQGLEIFDPREPILLWFSLYWVKARSGLLKA